MNLKSLIHCIALGLLVACSWVMTSCDSFNEDLPECVYSLNSSMIIICFLPMHSIRK